MRDRGCFVLNAVELGERCAQLMDPARNEWGRLGALQKHIDGRIVRTWTPDGADSEYRDLLAKAGTPWLAFGRDAIAQGVRASGYSDENVWNKVWLRNGMGGRQGSSTREAVGLGKSYLLLLPALDGEVFMRPLSALRTFAVYADPWDEYPAEVLYRVGERKGNFWDSRWLYVDAEGSYRFSGTPKTPQDVEFIPHGLGITPVVLVPNSMGDEGPVSSVAHAIPVYKRIVDATFTLQMVQRYGAFPQKWMAGGEIAVDPNSGRPLVNASVDSLLHASGESGETARFGSFQAANLTDVVNALEKHIKDLGAVLQVPPFYMLGAVVNMGADGIAATESGYHRNLEERRSSIGEGYELALRTGAMILGDTEASQRWQDHMDWENVSSWSLNQVADAFSKLNVDGVPLERLFQLVPGWSKSDAISAAAGVAAARDLGELEVVPQIELPD